MIESDRVMTDLELDLCVERLPRLIAHLAVSVAAIPGVGPQTRAELQAGLGMALAAAERLRAERLLSDERIVYVS